MIDFVDKKSSRKGPASFQASSLKSVPDVMTARAFASPAPSWTRHVPLARRKLTPTRPTESRWLKHPFRRYAGNKVRARR